MSSAPASPPPAPLLFTSNRLEALAAELAARIAVPAGGVLDAEVIVVPSRGMATWLEQELARRNGLLFHAVFPFPRRLLFDVFAAVCPELKLDDRFAPEPLQWALHRELTRLDPAAPPPGFEHVAGYLRDDPDGLRGLQLARKLARLFDDYLTFRPRMILDWEAGRHDDSLPDARWQAELWRKAIECGMRNAECGMNRPGNDPGALPASDFRLPTSLAHLHAEAVRRLRADGAQFTGLPRRVSLFGFSTLAPMYLDAFDALARHAEVACYALQPCAGYWADVQTTRERHRAARQAGREPGADADLHPGQAHRLLLALGRQGRAFQNQLLEFDWITDDEDRFVEPDGDSRLRQLQRGLLRLPEANDSPAPRTAPPEDRSIQLHSCHSPLRELQVLRDHLLDWFEHEGVRPRDVLVMAPDIETYAPLIPAVFGDTAGGGPWIPHSVADRSARRDTQLVDAFLHLLQLPRGRLPASAVLGFLECPAVARRLGFGPEEMEWIHGWLRESPVWWGFDAAERAALGFGELSPGTWRRGLDSLLLGYALGEGAAPLAGIVPFPNVTGERALCAGRLAEFVVRLRARLVELKTPRPLGEWAARLGRLLEEFFEPDRDDLAAVTLIRATIGQLWQHESLSGAGHPVGLAALAEHLRVAFDTTTARGGFLAGGVTFCALQPLRSVPARVICLLGMNDDAFPRRPVPAEFDLLKARPQPGDEARAEDDRHLFLETLISVRDLLYVSWLGQSIRDNTPQPPSVVVSELLDALTEAWGDDATQALITRHRLHPFSRAYFTGDAGSPDLPARRAEETDADAPAAARLFSYSAVDARAAALLAETRQPAPAFCPRPLPEAEESFRTVTLADLGEFLAHPAKFFLERRLDLRLPKADEELPDREVFELNALQRYGLWDELLEPLVAGQPADAVLEARWRETGRLPLGTAGALHFQDLAAQAAAFATEIRALGGGNFHPAVPLSLSPGPFSLTGTLTRVIGDGLLHYRPASLKSGDRLRLWLEMLALAAQRGAPVRGVLVGLEKARDGRRQARTETLNTPADPAARLTRLLEIYWEGLRRPLPFVPDSAFAFAEKSGENPAAARRAAREKWEGSEPSPGAVNDPHWRLCFARHGGDPFGAEFERLAGEIFGPLLAGLIPEEKPRRARKGGKAA